MKNREYRDLEEFAQDLNESRKNNPEDDCLDIIQTACQEYDAWTYTDDCDGDGYYEDDYVTDGLYILYLADDGQFKTRTDERFHVYYRNHTESFLIAAFQTIEDAKTFCNAEVKEYEYAGVGEPDNDTNAHSYEVYEGYPVASKNDDSIFKDPVYETGWYYC